MPKKSPQKRDGGKQKRGGRKMLTLSVMAWKIGIDEEELRQIARGLGITGYAVTQKQAAKIRRMCPWGTTPKTKRWKPKRPQGHLFAAAKPTTALRRAGEDDQAHFVQGGLPESKRRK